MKIALQNFDLDNYNNNLQQKNQAQYNLSILVNENLELISRYNYIRILFIIFIHVIKFVSK